MSTRPSLNVDGGELPGEPPELYAVADVVHVACGGHAGDEVSMERVARACLASGTRVGAHPSYEDREGFGRRPRQVAPDVLMVSIAAQCTRLRAVAERCGATVTSMKPHGALYHAADHDDALAQACVEGAREALGAVIVVGPADGALARAAARAGMPFEREAFADRGVRADGTLVPRGEPGAMIEEPARAAARAQELKTRGDVDTLCIHGDTLGAVEIARAVRDALGPKERAAR